ncbi:MAG: ExeM/NucH family extracellular endonuclease, partial [Anaerolineae bacterium]|nr:ExeM/NucH family extracellular endonuclease [Anaerolineae bacterium]
MNLLNFFNTYDGIPDIQDNCTNGVGGTAADCRGADTQEEFDRQWPKTVTAILEMDPDVLGIVEIENDGYGSDSAIQFLVDRLNDATSPGTYAFIDADAGTGQTNSLGTDAIKVGILYQPSRVTAVGQTATLNTLAFINAGDSGARNRATLAQAFEENATGSVFIVSVNHFKSKGSACDLPDAGDGQGNCNQVRVNAANELVSWLNSDPTGTGDSDILLLGDYNSYAMEDPITVFLNAGYADLIASLNGSDEYSYVFDGQWGSLDFALASPSLLAQISGVADYHVNADEPNVLDYNTNFKSAGQIIDLYALDEYRNSDHDPIVVGLDLDDVVVSPPITFYLHSNGSRNTNSSLFLDTSAPTSIKSNRKDSDNLKFAGGNPWKEIGLWSADPSFTVGTLTSLNDLHVWIGLRRAQNQIANYDLRIEVYKNDELISTSDSLCISGLEADPNLAQEITSSLGSFSPTEFDGQNDMLSIRFLTRLGTDGTGNSCGGCHTS